MTPLTSMTPMAPPTTPMAPPTTPMAPSTTPMAPLNAAIDDMIPGQALTEEEEIYKENILDHYRYPRNKGALDHYTFTHQELNPLCGDRIQVFVILDREGQVQENQKQERIAKVSFIGAGCAISQAAMSIFSEQIQGKSVSDIKKMGPWDIFNMLGIRISHTRSKCALLSLKTVQQGLREHLEKSMGETPLVEKLMSEQSGDVCDVIQKQAAANQESGEQFKEKEMAGRHQVNEELHVGEEVIDEERSGEQRRNNHGVRNY